MHSCAILTCRGQSKTCNLTHEDIPYHRCFGILANKCNCNQTSPELAARRHCAHHVNTVIVAENSVVAPRTQSIINYFIMIFERLYDKCAGYNLRYCPFRGFVGKTSYRSLLTDLMILICFLMTNFIILATIVTRMTLRVSSVAIDSAKWIQRRFTSSSSESRYNLSRATAMASTTSRPNSTKKLET